MKEAELQERMKELFAEYRASGLGIDEFMEKKLAAERKNGRAIARTAIRAFGEIDANYKAIRESVTAGHNRREWLRDRLEAAIREVGADRQRETVGEALAAAVDVLSGAEAGTTAASPFKGIDAVDWVSKLDETLTKNALVPLMAWMEGQPEKEDK